MDNDSRTAIPRVFLSLRNCWRSGIDQLTCGLTRTKRSAGEDEAHIIRKILELVPEANAMRPGEFRMIAVQEKRCKGSMLSTYKKESWLRPITMRQSGSQFE